MSGGGDGASPEGQLLFSLADSPSLASRENCLINFTTCPRLADPRHPRFPCFQSRRMPCQAVRFCAFRFMEVQTRLLVQCPRNLRVRRCAPTSHPASPSSLHEDPSRSALSSLSLGPICYAFARGSCKNRIVRRGNAARGVLRGPDVLLLLAPLRRNSPCSRTSLVTSGLVSRMRGA